MNILGYPLGLIMRLLYNILHSYGWSLILFTLLVRLVLVPLSIKQQKSSAKMAAIQPQMQEIQKMYAKNQTKMNEELQKLYQREKYNPAGGCLPMLITLLVLFGLIDVIYNPMQHILGISADVIAQATEIMKGLEWPSASTPRRRPSSPRFRQTPRPMRRWAPILSPPCSRLI